MRFLVALVACWVAFCLVIPGALIAYGEFRRWLADRYDEHQAQRAELTMQEAAAAPFAHTLDSGTDEYRQHLIRNLSSPVVVHGTGAAGLDALWAELLATPRVPEQRDGRWS